MSHAGPILHTVPVPALAFTAARLPQEAMADHSFSSKDLIRLVDLLSEATLLFLCDSGSGGGMLHANPVFNRLMAEEPQRERLQQAVDELVEELCAADPSWSPQVGAEAEIPRGREVRTAQGTYLVRGRYLASEGVEGRVALIVLERSTQEPLAEKALRQRFGLTPREYEVTRLIVEGKSSLAIAKALEISRHTVHHYTERVLLKLGVRSRGEVLAKILWG